MAVRFKEVLYELGLFLHKNKKSGDREQKHLVVESRGNYWAATDTVHSITRLGPTRGEALRRLRKTLREKVCVVE